MCLLRLLSTSLLVLLVIAPVPNHTFAFISSLRNKAGSWSLWSTTKDSLQNKWILRSSGSYEEVYREGSSDNFMVKEFSTYEQLEEIVKVAAYPMEKRPDGIVTIAKFTSASREDCRATEGDYERIARSNPATLFLRCFEEYEDADQVLAKAGVNVWPTFDIFYGGNRVARVEGPNYQELMQLLNRYQLMNSDLDLFSESGELGWGDFKKRNATKTPRTTNRFLPGYDWDKDRGFFDDLGDQFQDEWDKIYENWVPEIDPDD